MISTLDYFTLFEAECGLEALLLRFWRLDALLELSFRSETPEERNATPSNG